ncbi:MAG: branched-chain amino acid ABC transporter permease [Betaproteobacteria bacterium]|nr:branched-chain amino acid ABC transporter permease [Betaproteobacteria bacterium]
MIQAAISGFVSGGAYATLGLSIVLVYRMMGVLNFAQAAIGAFGAYVAFVLFEGGMPYTLAVPLGIAAAAAIGALLGLVMSTWFSEAGAEVCSTVSVAALITLLAAGFRIFGDSPRSVPDFFSGASFMLFGVVITATGAVAIGGAVILAFAIGLLLRRTRIGILLRALSERPTTAELLGIRARRLTLIVWAFAGAVSALAILIIAPTRTSAFLGLSMLIVPALAAALIGLLRSLEAAVLGGLGMGMLEGVATSIPDLAPYRQVLPFLVIATMLLWTERAEVWDARR